MSIEAPQMTLSEPEPSHLVLHHLNDSRSQRILWLLEELQVPYEIKKYQRLPSKFAPPELRAIHPLGQSPVITDGDVTLAESGAIIEYIITKYGNGRAQPPQSGYVDNLYYTRYSDGTLVPLVTWKYILTLVPDQSPFFIRPIARAVCNGIISAIIDKQLKSNFAMIEKHMQKVSGGWFAGGDEPTSADYMLIFGMEMASSRSGSVPENIKKYVERVHAMPSYQRGIEKGGEYGYASNH
ncbi:hypothetical protein FRB95_014408 [Tulasnella sp. JGI-2019a]|nr:hypothetical protein FRB93_013923 [Tulasnella sp. JGI-2019a]KAG9033721.1 hypothetical protein FRB95_014408 [Tulasnella sp. JGI-2019a]